MNATPKVKPKSKKIGRPVEIAAVNFVGVKLPTALLKAIDAWATDHKMTRSGTIRHLIERGLGNASGHGRCPVCFRMLPKKR